MTVFSTSYYDGNPTSGVEPRDSRTGLYQSITAAEARLLVADDQINQIRLGAGTFIGDAGFDIADGDTGTAGRLSLIYDDGTGAGGPNADGTYEIIKDVPFNAAASFYRQGVDGTLSDLMPVPQHLQSPAAVSKQGRLYLEVTILPGGTLTPYVRVWVLLNAS